MSQENVELVRSIYAAWERGDFSSVDWARPDIEYVFADGPVPGSWTGLAGMAGAWQEFLRTWDDYSVRADEFRELDNERVLVLDHRVARTKGSGVDFRETVAKGATLFQVHDGLVTRLALYADFQNAFADLGLSE